MMQYMILPLWEQYDGIIYLPRIDYQITDQKDSLDPGMLSVEEIDFENTFGQSSNATNGETFAKLHSLHSLQDVEGIDPEDQAIIENPDPLPDSKSWE